MEEERGSTRTAISSCRVRSLNQVLSVAAVAGMRQRLQQTFHPSVSAPLPGSGPGSQTQFDTPWKERAWKCSCPADTRSACDNRQPLRLALSETSPFVFSTLSSLRWVILERDHSNTARCSLQFLAFSLFAVSRIPMLHQVLAGTCRFALVARSFYELARFG